MLEPKLNYGAYKSVKAVNDFFIAVGLEYSQAVISKGQRGRSIR